MIETKRTLLRPIKLTDRDEIFAYRSDAETNKFQGWIPKKLEDVSTFINQVADEINTAQTWFQLVIIDKESHKIIGDIGIHFIDIDNQQCELGCTLSKNQHGKGFAIEVMKRIISFLFKTLNKHRITGSIDPNNSQSIKLLERLGFRKEAHFKESYFSNGKWNDDLVYAILNREWEV